MTKVEAVREVFKTLQDAGVSPDDHLGFLVGVVIGALRLQGFDYEGVKAELIRAVNVAAATPEPVEEPS